MNRAERMLEALADGQPRTRAELFRHAGEFYLTNNAASELRARLRPERDVAQWCAVENGKRIYVYQIVSPLPVAEALPGGGATPASATGSGTGTDGNHQEENSSLSPSVPLPSPEQLTLEAA